MNIHKVKIGLHNANKHCYFDTNEQLQDGDLAYVIYIDTAVDYDPNYEPVYFTTKEAAEAYIRWDKINA